MSDLELHKLLQNAGDRPKSDLGAKPGELLEKLRYGLVMQDSVSLSYTSCTSVHTAMGQLS